MQISDSEAALTIPGPVIERLCLLVTIVWAYEVSKPPVATQMQNSLIMFGFIFFNNTGECKYLNP